MLELVMKTNEVEDKQFTNFYLQLENGYQIRIKNCFKDDFSKLRLLARKID